MHTPYSICLLHAHSDWLCLSKFLRHTDFSLPPTPTTLIALHILEFLSCFLVHKCELFIWWPSNSGWSTYAGHKHQSVYNNLRSLKTASDHPGVLKCTWSLKSICLVCYGGNAPQRSLAWPQTVFLRGWRGCVQSTLLPVSLRLFIMIPRQTPMVNNEELLYMQIFMFYKYSPGFSAHPFPEGT